MVVPVDQNQATVAAAVEMMTSTYSQVPTVWCCVVSSSSYSIVVCIIYV